MTDSLSGAIVNRQITDRKYEGTSGDVDENKGEVAVHPVSP
jgi:hypothetical protein